MTLRRILTRYFLFILLSFSFFFVFAQEKEKSYCGTIPLEDAYLRDPFYENSEGLLDILRDNGYDMPKDYLQNLDTYGNYIGKGSGVSNKTSSPIIREIPIN